MSAAAFPRPEIKRKKKASSNEKAPKRALDRIDKSSGATQSTADSGFSIDPASKEAVADLEKTLKEITAALNSVEGHARALSDDLVGEKLLTDGGVSFLDAKSHIMLKYNIALTTVMLRKLEGGTLVGLPAIADMVRSRTLLEKMQPIEANLKYQVDKMIRAASVKPSPEDSSSNDPLQFKPNLSNLAAKSAGDDNDDEIMQDDRSVSKENAGFDSDGRVTGTVTGIYRPPRLAAMPYDEDVSARGRKEKKEARQAAKFANSEMMMELQSEFSSRPQEVSHDDSFRRGAAAKELAKRDELEEDNFIRTGGRKKLLKARAREMAHTSGLSDFDGSRHLTFEATKSSKKKSMKEQIKEIRKRKTNRKG